MAGRKRQPTAFKTVTGNKDKRWINKDEPILPNEFPDIPAHLTKKSKDAFIKMCHLLNDMGILTKADGLALERLCECYIEILECDTLIIKHGRVQEVISTQGEKVLKANPAVTQKADADRRFKSWLLEFGLTPSARTKVKINGDKEENEIDKFFE